MRLILLGDVMLGRLVNKHLATAPPAYPWGDTLSLLRSADALIVNLECVIADRGEPWPHKVFTFRSDAKNVDVLRAARVTAVSLANNHSLDYGPEALGDCLSILRRHDIRAAGAGGSIEAASAPASFLAGGQRVGIVAFTDNEPEWEAGAATPGVHHVPVRPKDPRFVRLLSVIEGARRSHDLVIVSTHWGPNWGQVPLPEHVEAARLFLDAGADLVFGHSPHILRGVELYRGKVILYSCGDYVDDYAVDEVERNDESSVFSLEYEGGGLKRLLLTPTVIRRFQARLAWGAARARIVEKVRALSASLGTAFCEVPEGLEVRLPAATTSGRPPGLPDSTEQPDRQPSDREGSEASR